MIERTDAVNWSTLKYIRESPKHYRYHLGHPREDTDALMRGRVTHTAVYEPEKLKQYVVKPRFHGGMKDETAIANGYDGGKQAKAEWEALSAAAGRTIVPAEIYADALAMRDAIVDDPVAGPMVTGGYSEQLITWTESDTNIECRGRIDHLNGRLSDLKTTRSNNPRAFASDVIRYGYHAQLAYYSSGLMHNGITVSAPPAIIAVENKAPYDVIVYVLTDAMLEAGRQLYRDCLFTLQNARFVDRWDGVSGGLPLNLEPPAWAMPEAEEITMGGNPIF